MSSIFYQFSGEEELSPASRVDADEGAGEFVAGVARTAVALAAASVLATASLSAQVAGQHQDELALAPPEEQDWHAPHVVRRPDITPVFIDQTERVNPPPSNPAKGGDRADVLYLWLGEDFPGFLVPLQPDDDWVQPVPKPTAPFAPLFAADDEITSRVLDDDAGFSPLIPVQREVNAPLWLTGDAIGQATQIEDRDGEHRHVVHRPPIIPDPYVDDPFVTFVAQLDETGWDPTRVVVTKPQVPDPNTDDPFVSFVEPPLDVDAPVLFAVKQPVALPLDVEEGDALGGIRVEDDPWTAPVVGVQATVQPAFTADDEVAGLHIAEDFWDPTVVVLRSPTLPPTETGDEAVGPIALEDYEWEAPLVVVRAPAVPRPWVHDASGELLPARAVPLPWIIEPDEREDWIIEAGS